MEDSLTATQAFDAMTNFLEGPEIDHNKIGIIGLSEGGLIAAMLSAECPDIAFAVLMASSVASDMTSWLDQTALQLRADGASQEFIDRDRQVRTLVYQLRKSQTQQKLKKSSKYSFRVSNESARITKD